MRFDFGIVLWFIVNL